MLIIIEGLDATGKSTLAQALSTALGLPIIASLGPPRYPGEINIRLERYSHLSDVICDRHPVISQTIYGQLRRAPERVAYRYEKQLYDRKPVFIYCDISNGAYLHTHKTHDTPQHLHDIESNHHLLLASYRSWAIKYAFLWYRIGDDMQRITTACSALALKEKKT